VRLLLDHHPPVGWANEFEYVVDKVPRGMGGLMLIYVLSGWRRVVFLRLRSLGFRREYLIVSWLMIF